MAGLSEEAAGGLAKKWHAHFLLLSRSIADQVPSTTLLYTLDPEPDTLNPKPETLKPKNLNPKP